MLLSFPLDDAHRVFKMSHVSIVKCISCWCSSNCVLGREIEMKTWWKLASVIGRKSKRRPREEYFLRNTVTTRTLTWLETQVIVWDDEPWPPMCIDIAWHDDDDDDIMLVGLYVRLHTTYDMFLITSPWSTSDKLPVSKELVSSAQFSKSYKGE